MDQQKRWTWLVKWMGRVSKTKIIVMFYQIDASNANSKTHASFCTLHRFTTFLLDASDEASTQDLTRKCKTVLSQQWH